MIQNFMHIVTLILLVQLFSTFSFCQGNNTEKKINGLIADAGEDLAIPSASYAIFDISDSYLGIDPDLSKIRIYWEQDKNNPEKVLLTGGGYTPITKVGFVKEGTYRFLLMISNGIDTSNIDEKIIIVGQREKSFIEDPHLETKLRYNLKKQNGVLTKTDLLKIDSIAGYNLTFHDYPVKSIKGVEFCKNLTYVSLNLEDIDDLTPLKTLSNITYLSINQNYNLKNVDALAQLVSLEYLDIESNNIEDITSLTTLKKLKFFNIMYNHKISDINVIGNFSELEQLLISGHNIDNIEPVSKLTHLQNLWAIKCNLTDISPVENLTEIEHLYLRFNHIKSITPLKKLQRLTKLYLWENEIENISVLEYLPDLRLIELRDNKIKDILPLVKNVNIKNGAIVNLSENPLSDQSINEYLPELLNRGVVVFR